MNLKMTFLILMVSSQFFLALKTKAAYNQPPNYILNVMRAPQLPSFRMSPDRQRTMLVYMQSYPSITRVAEPYLKLAGSRIEPKNRSKHDTNGGYGVTSCIEKVEIIRHSDKKIQQVKLPKDTCPTKVSWSNTGKEFAIEVNTEKSVDLWIGRAESGQIKKIPGLQLNPMFGYEFIWMPQKDTLLVKSVPENQGRPPQSPMESISPSIQESIGGQGQSSTYEARDTLQNEYDEKLFDYYGKSQLVLVNISSFKKIKLAKPAIYNLLNPSPDGQYIFFDEILRPYSYIVTHGRFPRDFKVWQITTEKVIEEKLIAHRDLADRVPIHGEPTGPRDFDWQGNEPATLIWAEALDGGDWAVKVPFRDRIMMQKAPFQSPATEIAKTEQRFESFDWTQRKEVALLTEYDHNKHWTKTFIVNFTDLNQKPELLWDRSSEETYKNPGQPVYERLANGKALARMDQDSIYLTGQGSSPEGDRPFLDKLNLKTKISERLFRSEKSTFTLFGSFAKKDSEEFYSVRQTILDPPNLFLNSLKEKITSPEGEAIFNLATTPVTSISDPAPEVRKIKKRLVKYKRADGIDLSFTIYTPPDYVEGTRVPTILYAYPLDYADASKAGQVAGSEFTFTRLYQYKFMLLAGYAIIDNASFPIIGDPQKAYDNYLEQLVADAKAAVDEAVRLGIADPDRIGVTGHSHGALMTVNLLAHSNLFKAGVASSGSYNKTLTPFGFQNERRSLWQAPEVYNKVSPFFASDKLKTPILIVHGADDANPGTTPLQATKLFEAIRGNGGTTRLVLLPFEPHWYSAKESNEQFVYEMLEWFNKYVKGEVKKSEP